MAKSRHPPLFRRVSLSAKDAKRSLGDPFYVAMLNWAKTILRRAKLPPDLRAKLKKNGSGKIIILDETIVKPDTLEWHAARVVLYLISMRRHIESENATDAAWCAMAASDRYWIAFIEHNLAANYHSGRGTRMGAARSLEARRSKSKSGDTYSRFVDLKNSFPSKSGNSWAYRKLAKQIGISEGAVAQRVKRRRLK